MSEGSEPSLPSRRGHVIYVKAQVGAFARSIAVGKSNVVQTTNATAPRSMTLFPTRTDWDTARRDAALETSAHDDMHAGELEASILAEAYPEVLRDGALEQDHVAGERSLFLIGGMSAYTRSGVIGRPSAATAAKGKALLDSLTASFGSHLQFLDEQQ